MFENCYNLLPDCAHGFKLNGFKLIIQALGRGKIYFPASISARKPGFPHRGQGRGVQFR
jgi:hypothetical protein